MMNLTFLKASRLLLAAALAAPVVAAAQTTPAASTSTSTTISTNTSATVPGVGSVLSGTTRAVGGAARTVGGAAGGAVRATGGAARTVGGAASGAARATGGAAAAAYHAAAPEKRAAHLSQKLKQELSLDASTTAKVQAAALVRAQKIDAIQTGTTTNQEKNAALQANAQEFKTTLQSILTPAQYTQYLNNVAKAKVSVQAGASTDIE